MCMVLLTSSRKFILASEVRLNGNYHIARKETRIHATPDRRVLRCLCRSMKPLSPYRCRGRILNLQKSNDGSLRKLMKDLTPLVKQTIQNQKDLFEKYKRRSQLNLREEFYKLMSALPLVVFHG